MERIIAFVQKNQLYFRKKIREIFKFILSRKTKTKLMLVLVAIASVLMLHSFFSQFYDSRKDIFGFSRVGTEEHLKNPMSAISLGFRKPLLGNLAQVGAGAKIKNFRENNDDSALLPENIYAEILAQMGFLGLLFFVLFMVFLFKNSSKSGKFFVLCSVFLGSLTSLFDMTPITISFFIVYALVIDYSQ